MVVGPRSLTDSNEGLRYSPSSLERVRVFTEMNIHLPQSLQTRNELAQLASVPNQILTPKDSKPIVSIVQDIALGVYRMTKSVVYVTEKQFFNFMATNPKFMGQVPIAPSFVGQDDLKKVKKWSGRQLLSAILPPNVNYRGENKSFVENKTDDNGNKVYDAENYVVIENGVIKQGRIDTKVYQDRSKGLIHSIYNDYGPEEARVFLDNTQQLVCNWLVSSGFSVGISDLIIDQETNDSLKQIIHDMKVKVYDIIQQVHSGQYVNDTRNNNTEKFERDVNQLLNDATNKIGKKGLSKIDDMNNRMLNMINSGAKGNAINIAQMVGCLGQQNVDGRRIAYGYDNRTLPHYTKFDDGPESRGFVENSFIKGLTPQEFFFHAMGGREGLIDTAVKTSSTGYAQRKLVKAMEDCKVSYDLTVRNANGNIVQFLYGEDGVDAIKIETQPLYYITMDPPTLEKEYFLSVKDDMSCYLLPDTFEEFQKERDWEDDMFKHFKQILEDREFIIKKMFNGQQERTVSYPIGFQRIIENTKSLYAKYNMDNMMTDLNPCYVLNVVNKLCDELCVTENNKGNKLLGMLLRMYLSPKQMIVRHHFTKSAFDQIVTKIKMKYYDSIVNPSEMVGVVAAQSIGEPATQLSCLRTSKVLISTHDKTKTFYGNMGDFIDKMLDDNKERVVDLGGESVVFDPKDDYYIVGVSDKEKTSWRRILQVSRHPAHGGMIRVHTKSGKTTCATLSHSFLKRTVDSIVPVKGADLKVGNRIPVAKYIPEIKDALMEIDGFHLDNELGWFLGMYLADGNVNYHEICISKIIPEVIDKVCAFAKNNFGLTARVATKQGRFYDNEKLYDSTTTKFTHPSFAKFIKAHFGSGSYKKTVPGWVFNANTEFIKGVIAGYFDGDGNVAHGHGKGMIRAHSVNETLVDGIILLLAFVGIFASKTIEKKNDGRLNSIMHSIQVPRKYASAFKNIGLVVKSKKEGLESVVKYVTRDNAHSQGEYIDKIPEVGDLIALCGKELQLLGQSRSFGRWMKKNSIGRTTLIKYIGVFEEANKEKNNEKVSTALNILKQAAYSDIVWDEIVNIEYLDDPLEHVYDFTVPGNDSFMVDCGVLVHNTLNTFHLSGVASASKAVRGVPRIEELTRVTKNSKAPSMNIYIKSPFSHDKPKCMKIKNMLEITTFKEIVKTSRIYYDPDDFNTGVETDRPLMELYRDYQFDNDEPCDRTKSPWLLRLELDRVKMLDIGLTMIDLHVKLNDHYRDRISCTFSDDNAGDLIFRIRLFEDGVDTDKKGDTLTELKALESTLIENQILKGIEKVNKVELIKKDGFTYNDETKLFENSFEWCMDSDGTNLIEVLGNPFVDTTRTISNDVNEIYTIFGVEAARQCLYNELDLVMADAKINYRHLALLVDTMTLKGNLMSIDRHGINKGDIGPLAKCSFEEVNDVLVKAGVFSEIDRVNGVSSNIILGQLAPCGTGDTDILIDERKLRAPTDKYLKEEARRKMMPEIDEDVEQVCHEDNLTFDFIIPEADNNIVKKQNMVVNFVNT